ncbi:MAG TPA: phosphate/phosphite/phosphonate ABC transporter substrate-binding protein [bacterium]|nr:phosphate/phosphite/phosphonate ABC transporter substrate-binding protein [bacterium]
MPRRTFLAALLTLTGLIAAGCPPAPPKELPKTEPNAGTPGADTTGEPAPANPDLAGAAETPPQPIKLGLTPAEGGAELQESAAALNAYLQQETGLTFEVTTPQDYGLLIEAMRYDQVHFAALAPLSFVKAETEAGARVLLKSLRKSRNAPPEAKGEPFYYAVIFALKSSGITDIAGLKGKAMAFGDPLSTAGTIFPKAGLIKQGIDPNTYFAKANNVGNHEVVVNAVANGDYDAGATFCSASDGTGCAWEQFLPEKADQFQIVWTSDPIPADTISVKGTFQDQYPQTTEEIRQAFLRLNDTPEGQKMLKDLYRIDGLVEAQSGDYDIVREAARLVDIPIQ